MPKIELSYLRDQEEINRTPSFSDVLARNSIVVTAYYSVVTQPSIYIELLSFVPERHILVL